MDTNLICEIGHEYTVFSLLSDLTVENSCVTPLGVAVMCDGAPAYAPQLGPLDPHNPWFGPRCSHHWPPEFVAATIEKAVKNGQSYGGCCPVRRVRSAFGGGYLALSTVPDWLVENGVFGWKHDGRFHTAQCPEKHG